MFVKAIIYTLAFATLTSVTYGQQSSSIYQPEQYGQKVRPRDVAKPIVISDKALEIESVKSGYGRRIRLMENSMLIVRLEETIGSNADRPYSTVATAIVMYSVRDYLGQELIPRFSTVLLEYSAIPGKRFHRNRGELTLSIRPVQVPFEGEKLSNCSDCADFETGVWEFKFSHTLESVTSSHSGKTLEGKGESRLIASRFSSQDFNSPDIGLIGNGAASALISIPGGAIIHGLGMIGAGAFKFALGKSNLTLPEGTTIRFNLANTVMARNITAIAMAENGILPVKRDVDNAPSSHDDSSAKQNYSVAAVNQDLVDIPKKLTPAAMPQPVRSSDNPGRAVPYLSGVVVVVGMDASVDGSPQQPIPAGTQADFLVRYRKTGPFAPVAMANGDQSGTFRFTDVPCGCEFKVVARQLDVPGAARKELPLKVDRPLNYPKNKPLPCKGFVNLGRYSLRLASENGLISRR